MRILFQGDSITDAGRNKSDKTSIGGGYPMLVKAALGYEKPLAYEFHNRGISGDRIVDLYARIKKDILNLRPDVMSILVGVNDVWHEFSDTPNGVDADKYFKVYALLIEEIKAELPNIKMMILEPFVLRGTGTDANWELFHAEVLKRAQMAKKIADTYGLTFVPLQSGFDALTERAPADYWLSDGVHPTKMGHEFIKLQWIKAFQSL